MADFPPAEPLSLAQVRGFVFDVDGTLAHRGLDGRAVPQPGAVEVLDRIRGSDRPFVLFTNGSHKSSAAIARELREDGLPISDDQVLTPVDSTLSYLRRNHPGRPALLLATAPTRDLMVARGVVPARSEEAEVVFVAHVDEIDIASLERAARAVRRGAPLLTGSYVSAYAGAHGPILSRGAMVTAAIAKAARVSPRIVGKPSRAAVAQLREHLRLPSRTLAVIGDDVEMDIALGHIGGSLTVLVRSGISDQAQLDRVPARRRPHAVIDGVGDLLELL